MKRIKIEYDILKDKNVADFLVVTATEIETKCLMNVMKSVCHEDAIIETECHEIQYRICRIGHFNVLNVQCAHMGTQEIGSSLMITQKALNDWSCIKAVIMVGIAFGMYNEDKDESKQRYGDILVASEIFPYESQRVGEKETKYRGESHKSDTNFLKAFTLVKQNWNELNIYEEKTTIELCQIITGEKLVDNLEFRNKLKVQFPDSRGGEMEGMGIATCAEARNLPWALVKSICDFGDGNKKDDKDNKQECAARLAAIALEKAFLEKDVLMPIVGEKKSEYLFLPDKNSFRKAFFTFYEIDCEPFYYKRSIDDKLKRIIERRGCWVSGISGVGKTTALRRAVLNSNKEFILINLAAYSNSSIFELFNKVYIEICKKVKETPLEDISRYPEQAEEIKNLLTRHYQNKELYLFIEEIPIDSQNAKVFTDFAVSLFSLVILGCSEQYDLKMVLSSLSSPKILIPDYQSKIGQYLKFIDMPQWTEDEGVALVNLINRYVPFSWEKYKIEDFVKDCGYSPRTIKQKLSDFSCFGDYCVTKKLVEYYGC